MEIGIVGLPNAGKSTLFNAITRGQAEVASYPFTTISSNVGVAEVPDERLWAIASILKPAKVISTHIKFVDIAGLVKGASRGEGLGNQFLSFIRNVDAIAHVVRCFESTDIAHPYGQINPREDIETVNLELTIADLAMIERLKEKAAKQAKAGDKQGKQDLVVLEEIADGLERGVPIRLQSLSLEETASLQGVGLLTDKPMIYVANVSEEDLGSEENALVKEVEEIATKEKAGVVAISAKLEAEIAELEQEEAAAFLEDLGLEESGLARLVRECYDLLGLITFFTIESNECRAWTIREGTRAPQAAGKIHTDMERGFIKAEVVNWKYLADHASFHAAREAGHFLVEGKEYVVKDGDVILFKFAT